MEWKPIETAPKDGTPIRVYDGETSDFQTIVTYNDNNHFYPWEAIENLSYSHHAFTHWQALSPLPEPPKGGE